MQDRIVSQTALGAVRDWSLRRRLAAIGFGLACLAVSGVPTGIIETPFYVRMTPVEWWQYPLWVFTSILAGMLVATYMPGPRNRSNGSASTGGGILGGGLLSVFAVGCPVCNKLVVLALGYTGAMSYFASVQPVLGALSAGLLVYALRARLVAERSCPTRRSESAGP